jgi:rhodanese-related sulfurtransferase
MMKTISLEELQPLLAAHPDLALLDVRTAEEYEEVHVPRAQNEPLSRLEPKDLFESGRFRQGQPVYVLCRTGVRAKLAAEHFALRGFDQAVVVQGGTVAWAEAGLPVDRGAAPKSHGVGRRIWIAAALLAFVGAALALLVHFIRLQ